MDRTRNVKASSLLAAVTWQKSHHSNPSGECVEMAALPSTGVAIRNSRDPDGPALICTRAEVGAFIEGAKNGEFDLLVALSGSSPLTRINPEVCYCEVVSPPYPITLQIRPGVGDCPDLDTPREQG